MIRYSQDIGRRKYRRYLSEFYGLGSARREKGGRENIQTEEIFFVDADYLVVATGAVPFMPAFENDDLPGCILPL